VGGLAIIFEGFAFCLHSLPLQTFIYDEGHYTAIFILKVVGELAVSPQFAGQAVEFVDAILSYQERCDVRSVLVFFG
jgi:hypothetical protein